MEDHNVYHCILDAMKKHGSDPYLAGKAVDTLASLSSTGWWANLQQFPQNDMIINSGFSSDYFLRSLPLYFVLYLSFKLKLICQVWDKQTLSLSLPLPLALSDANLKESRAYSFVLAALQNHYYDVNVQSSGLLALANMLKTGTLGNNYAVYIMYMRV